MMDKLFTTVLLLVTMKPCVSQTATSEGRTSTTTSPSPASFAFGASESSQAVAIAVNVVTPSDVTTTPPSSPAGATSASSSTAAASSSGTDAGSEAGPHASSSSPLSSSSRGQSADDDAVSPTTMPSSATTATSESFSATAAGPPRLGEQVEGRPSTRGAGEGPTSSFAAELPTTVPGGAGRRDDDGGGGQTEASAGEGVGSGGSAESATSTTGGSASAFVTSPNVVSSSGDLSLLSNSSQSAGHGSASLSTTPDVGPSSFSSSDSNQSSPPPPLSTASNAQSVSNATEAQSESTQTASSSPSSSAAVPSPTTSLYPVSPATNGSEAGVESSSSSAPVLSPASSNESSTQAASTISVPTFNETSSSRLPGEMNGTAPTQNEELPSTTAAATVGNVSGSAVATSAGINSTTEDGTGSRTTPPVLTAGVNAGANSSTGAVTDGQRQNSSSPSPSATQAIVTPTTNSSRPTPTISPTTATTTTSTASSSSSSSPSPTTTPEDKTAPKDARYLLILRGDCGLVLNNTEFFSRFLAGLHDLIVKQFRVARDTYRLGDISCGSVRVYVTFINVIMPDFDFLVQSVVQNGGQGLSVPVWIDSHFATFDLYRAQHVPLSPDERTFHIVAEVMDDVDIIVIIVACCVCGILIAIGVAICAKECYRRKHAQSFNLLEVPHVNLKLEDFTLTRIPRPKTVFTAHPHDPAPDPVKSYNMGDEAGSSKGFSSEPASNGHHALSSHPPSAVGDGMVCNGNSNGALGPTPRDLHLRVSQHSDGIIVGVTASPSPSSSSPTSRSSSHHHHHNGGSHGSASAVNGGSATSRQGRQVESGSPRFKAKTRTPAADDFSVGEYQASERLLDGSRHHGDDVEGGTVNPVFIDDPEAAPGGGVGVASQAGGGDRGRVGDAS